MSKARRIFVVDDDDDIRCLLKTYLEKHQFYVETAESGEVFLDAFAANSDFDLIILDIMLPGEDGFSICRQLRTSSYVPVIMLTANSDEMDRIIGLEIGADDYLAKPFNPRELLARMKAILRRMDHIDPATTDKNKTHTIFTFAGFSMNTVSRELTNPSGVTDSLTGADYNLLTLFLNNPGKVLSRDQIAETTRGRDSSPLDRFIDVHISRLRQRLGEDARHPQMIKTIRGAGYILTVDVQITQSNSNQS
ncbi:response regulator [Marinomonas sp. 2405UD68-3]|uniref:response regulator n=1 Tax=Marinomonas sp. 2405UD68-3 TaxID=3391835 RepID=UPI0039C8DDD3